MSPQPSSLLRIALIGNPNCGKTTLFNALTGANQRVGNWPGVTVECKLGKYFFKSQEVEVVDLPGIYSLLATPEHHALDETIASEYLFSGQADLIVNIVDASNLERNLYLTLQLLELGLPCILAVNMLDEAEAKQLTLDLPALAEKLHCPVVGLISNKHRGVYQLKETLLNHQARQSLYLPQTYYRSSVREAIDQIHTFLQPLGVPHFMNMDGLALRLLEGDPLVQQLLPQGSDFMAPLQTALTEATANEIDLLIADQRYQVIHRLLKKVVDKKQLLKPSLTHLLDKFALHRILGLPIFLLLMYSMFLFAINIGGAFQDFFDISSQTLFVDGAAYLLKQWHAPPWLIAILATGVGKGLNTVVTFIPVLGAMFLFLSFLEASGYMARAAFLVDRLMQKLGLPGKSFIPMIVGFGCNVPAIMAARTLENPRDRILTIMMSPFMSCGARLAIYAVFTTAFFPTGGQNIIFALYLIGILVAVFTGFILRHRLLAGQSSHLIMELPPYRKPTLQLLGRQTWGRLKGFLTKAGKVIVPLCMILGALNAFTLQGTAHLNSAAHNSLLSMIGQALTPLFAPMGIHMDNWPATVGLLTGILAKEVVVATLNTLYSQIGHLAIAQAGGFDLWGGLQAAVLSIPDNLRELGSVFLNPIRASAPMEEVSQGVYGQMYSLFGGKIPAFAYLLFILLYFPCVTATAAIARELNWRWALLAMGWTTGIAYIVAVTFYQLATIHAHPQATLGWIIGFSSFLCLAIWRLKYMHLPLVAASSTRQGCASRCSKC